MVGRERAGGEKSWVGGVRKRHRLQDRYLVKHDRITVECGLMGEQWALSVAHTEDGGRFSAVRIDCAERGGRPVTAPDISRMAQEA